MFPSHDRFYDKGQPKFHQMMDDIHFLTRKEDVIQKMMNEVGAKMKEHYIKSTSQINVNGKQEAPKAAQSDNLSAQIEYIWNTK